MKHSRSTLLTATLLILLTSGCQMMNKPAEEEKDPAPVSVFNFEGIPSQNYYVGGGFIVRYRASRNGILYIAEEESGRLLGTVSMAEGEKFEVIYDINDEDMISNLKAVGIDPGKAVIKLYFVPKTDFL